MRTRLAAALPRRYRSPHLGTRVADIRRLRDLRRQVARICVPPPRSAFGAFGRSVIVPPARVESPDCVFVGDGTVIHEHSWFSVVRHFPGIEPRVVIGDDVRIGRCCQFSVARELIIERNAIIGDFVQIGDTFHPWDVDDRMPALVDPSPVHIGQGAIVASHVVVLPGVTIGAGAYVEHHSIVQHDVAAGQVVSGRPARPVPGYET